jgi:hypothetical protein
MAWQKRKEGKNDKQTNIQREDEKQRDAETERTGQKDRPRGGAYLKGFCPRLMVQTALEFRSAEQETVRPG